MVTFSEQVSSLPSDVALAVLGDPVAHSLSPAMQNAGLAARALPLSYGRLRVTEAELPKAFQELRSRFHGWNLTLPLKLTALPLVDELDPEAQWLGAINTVVRRDQKLIGFNTDGLGLHRALEAAFGAAWRSAPVTLIGAGGGAGSAAARYLARTGIPKLTLVNRTRAKLQTLHATLEKTMHVRIGSWEELPRAIADSRLVINASSLGLDGTPLDWDPAWLDPGHLVLDLVYRREPTPVVTWARRAGASAVDGLDMLLFQGAEAFRLWFGQPVPEAEMRHALYAAAFRHNSSER
ncbi:MAG: shikimate dehydrogenase [Verrucomicrobia bacterium]|nr:shikimate dehydrogenase [Verrucomicrobiota bacterium]